MTVETPPKEGTLQKLSSISNIQALTDYWNSSLSIGFSKRERLSFYSVLFLLTSLSVVTFHLLFSESQHYVELSIHALLIGAGYCMGLGLFELTLRGIVQKWKAVITIKVATAWCISLGGFILGFLLLAPFQDYFTPLHPLQKDRIPLEWFIKMFPIWGLFTFLFVQHFLKRTIAAERVQLQAINEYLVQRLVERSKSEEAQFQSQPFVVNIGREIETINAFNISHFTVEEHYCSIYVLENETIRRVEVKLSLKDALTRLPETTFIQIHRSHVVNLTHVQRIQKTGRSYELIMGNSDMALPVSRIRLTEVLGRIKKTLQ